VRVPDTNPKQLLIFSLEKYRAAARQAAGYDGPSIYRSRKTVTDPAASRSDAESHPVRICTEGLPEVPSPQPNPLQNKIEDAEKEKQKTLGSKIRAAILSSWIVLFFFVPAGFAVNYTHRNAATVFSVNFVAIIPSVFVLGFAIDELVLQLKGIWGGLLCMTFRYILSSL
jgi:hypothetical protein